MKPVLASMPEIQRTALFVPALLGLAFVLFVVVGFASDAFLPSLMIGVLGGIGGAYALFGWPVIRRKDGKPVITAKVKPWFFFLLFPLLLLSVYWVLGVYLTPFLPPDLTAYTALGLALVIAGAASYFLVGFPDLAGYVRTGWGRIPKDRRPWLFFPIYLVLCAVTYFVVGLGLTQTPLPLEWVAFVGLAVGLSAPAYPSYRLVGFPRPDEKAPWRPWLFFPLYLFLATLLYVTLGLVFTQTPLPLEWVATTTLFVSILLPVYPSYRLVGFPRPDEKAPWRPWLFFPLYLFLATVLYVTLGLVLTQTPMSVDWVAVTSLAVALLAPAYPSYRLVGFPQPTKPVKAYVPDVPARGRPMAFGITFLLVGLPLSFLCGLLLEAPDLLSAQVTLPIALVLGYAASFGVSVASWGHPGQWRRMDGYTPGIPPALRIALFVPVAFGVTMVGTVIVGVIGLDVFWGLLSGGTLGLVAALYASGAIQHYRQARGSNETLLPPLPDKVKPLVLFPTWFITAGLLYVITTYVLPSLAFWNFIGSALVGLTFAILLVEEPLIREILQERRQEKTREERLEALRKKRLEAVKEHGTANEPELAEQ